MSEDSHEHLDKNSLAEDRTEMAEDRSKLAEERTEQAEDRTEWAQHRTLLANERNFSAWIRTGLAAIGGGLAVAKFVDEGVSPLARILGVILVLIGAGVCAVAIWRYRQISDVLEEKGFQVIPKWVVYLLIGGLMLSAIIMLAIILIR